MLLFFLVWITLKFKINQQNLIIITTILNSITEIDCYMYMNGGLLGGMFWFVVDVVVVLFY